MTVRNRRHLLLFFAFFVRFSTIGYTQIPAHWYLNKESGLPTNTVYRILQDKNNLIWIATSSGLVRYNSLELTTFSSSDLKDEEFIELNLDSLNRVWVTNLSNQIAYVEDDKLKTVKLLNLPSKKLKYTKIGFTKDYLVLSISPAYVSRGIYSFLYTIPMEHVTAEIDLSKYLQQSVNYSILGIEKINDVLVYVSSKSTLSKIFATDSIIHQVPEKAAHLFSTWESAPRKFQVLDKKAYIFHSSYEYLTWNSKQEIIHQKSKVSINSITKLGNTLWLLSTKGLQFFDTKTQSLTPNTVFSDHVFSRHFKDNEGNIWLSTLNKGILIIPSIHFQGPSYNQSPIFSLSAHQTAGSFFAGGRNRLLLYNAKGKSTDLSPDFEIGRVLSIATHKGGNMAIGCDNGTFWMEGIHSKMVRLQGSGATKKVLFDYKGTTWTGVWNSLLNFATVPPWKEGKQIVFLEKTLALEEDYNRNIWAGTINGLYKIRHRKEISRVGEDTSYSYFIKDIKMGLDSFLYVATSNQGILKVNPSNLVVEHLNLPYADCFNTLICDKKGLWLGGNKGILYYNFQDSTTRHISRYDGLPSNEINALLRRGPWIWAATSKGLVKFPGNIIYLPRPPATVTIKKIYANGTAVSLQDFLIPLAYNQNNLRIEFESINYYLRGTTEFKYRLLPSGEWINTKQSFAQFSNLTPGQYCFELGLTNNVETDNLPKIYFNIDKPWWQKLWVQLLFTLFTVGTTIWISFTRQKKIIAKDKKEKEVHKKIAELKITALQAQMNPHFIFNCLNSIQYFILNNDEDLAMKTLGMFSKLIRDVFDYSAKKMISLEAEFDFIKLYIDLEKLRFDDSLKININVSEYLQDNLFALQSPPLLIQPIIENAFEHGLLHKKGEKILNIDFSMEGKYLKCVIYDNGVGRNYTEVNNQWEVKNDRISGIKLTKERLLILDDSPSQTNNRPLFVITDLKSDVNGLATGTKVEMLIKTIT